MKACRLVAPEHYEVFDTAIPKPAKGEVLVRVIRVAICGSDVHIFHNIPPLERFPSIAGFSGHEAVGVVEHSSVSEWKPGDRVLVIPPRINAFAEYVSVPASQLVPLPADVPMEPLVISQQLGTVLFCWRKMNPVLDKVVAVLGQGPAGLMFTALARRMGAQSVIGIDLVSHRLEVAKQMGADAVINAGDIDPAQALADLTHGQLADVAIEAVGKPETIDGLSRLVRIGGEMVFFGIPPAGIIGFDFERFFRRYARTVTSAGAPMEPGFRSFRLAIEMIRHGVIDVRPLISHVLPLDEIQKGFLLADSKADGAVKIVLDPTIG